MSAWAGLGVGLGITAYGVLLISVPAALILVGISIAAVALFGVNIDEEGEK